MKYVVIIPDGAADQPLEDLNGQTPLEAAKTPAMDQVSAMGVLGEANFVPAGYPVSSEVAILGLLGVDPREYSAGRAAVEALARGLTLEDGQWAVRCNLVTIKDGQLVDPSAGSISDEEASELLEYANQQLQDSDRKLVPGSGYRNLLILGGESAKGLSADTRLLSPSELTGSSILDAFPRGPRSEVLCDLMDLSHEWFAEHPVNLRRREAGLPEATCLWFWGAGQTPKSFSFSERYGKSGSVVGAVDVIQGLGKMLGFERISVPTATGMPDTDYQAKGAAACGAIGQSDLVVVHIEAPDEASHQGDAAAKVKSLEEIDRWIVAPILERLQAESDWRLLVSPDHQTLTSTRRHQEGPVCFAAAGSGIAADDWSRFSEKDADCSTLKFREGWKLLPWFLGL